MKLDVHAPVLLAPGEGEVVTDRPERTLRILVDLDDLIVTWFRYEPGQKGPDPHIHEHHTDAFYVLEGEVEISLGPELTTVNALPGTIAAAPPNLVHTFRNASDASAVFLNLHVPSTGFGDYMRGRNPAFDQHEPPGRRRPSVAEPSSAAPAEAELVEHRHERAADPLRPAAALRPRPRLSCRSSTASTRTSTRITSTPSTSSRARSSSSAATSPAVAARDVLRRAAQRVARVPQPRARAAPRVQPPYAARRLRRPRPRRLRRAVTSRAG